MRYIRLMRIHQWVKNIFVFIPIFLKGDIFNISLFSEALIGFFIFSFISSSVYIINDYMDIEKDRLHPEKKNRPLASGKVSKSSAFILLIILITITYTLLYYFGNNKVLLVITAYFIMNLFYSFKLKHITIVDIVIIAIGFLMRVFVGGAITDTYISLWTIMLTFFLALIMAAGKRRGELLNTQLEGNTRKVLEGYTVTFLDVVISIVCTITIVCYMMYTVDPNTIQRINKNVIYTSIFVVVGILRYLQLIIVFNRAESPTKVLYKDLFLQIDLILWIISIFILIYYRQSYG